MPAHSPESLEYSAFPMKESIPKAIFFWLIVIFTIWGVWLNAESLLVALVAGTILIGSLNSFYLPTYYKIDSEGASWRRFHRTRSIEWKRVRRCIEERDGIFLSPFAGRMMMENFRGIYLPFRSNREAVLFVVRHFAPDAFSGKGNSPDDKDTVSQSPPRNYFGHQR